MTVRFVACPVARHDLAYRRQALSSGGGQLPPGGLVGAGAHHRGRRPSRRHARGDADLCGRWRSASRLPRWRRSRRWPPFTGIWRDGRKGAGAATGGLVVALAGAGAAVVGGVEGGHLAAADRHLDRPAATRRNSSAPSSTAPPRTSRSPIPATTTSRRSRTPIPISCRATTRWRRRASTTRPGPSSPTATGASCCAASRRRPTRPPIIEAVATTPVFGFRQDVVHPHRSRRRRRSGRHALGGAQRRPRSRRRCRPHPRLLRRSRRRAAGRHRQHGG